MVVKSGKTTGIVIGEHERRKNVVEKTKEVKPVVDVVLDKNEKTMQTVPAKHELRELVKDKKKEESSKESKKPMEQETISQEITQFFLTKETRSSQNHEKLVKTGTELGSNKEEKLKQLPSHRHSSFDDKEKPAVNINEFISTCLDVEMEDLPVNQIYVDNLKQFTNTETDPNESTKLIGKIGEEITYNFLYDQYEAKIKTKDIAIE